MLISQQGFPQGHSLASNSLKKKPAAPSLARPDARAMLGALPALLLSNGVYKDNEPVTLYANKVGRSPTPGGMRVHRPVATRLRALAARLRDEARGPRPAAEGRPPDDRQVQPGKEDMPYKSLCKLDLTETMADRFKASIVDDYYFEMMLDELPIWGYVGELETTSVNFEREYDNSTRCARRAAQFRRAARNSSAPRAIPPRGVAERAPPRAAGPSASRTSTLDRVQQRPGDRGQRVPTRCSESTSARRRRGASSSPTRSRARDRRAVRRADAPVRGYSPCRRASRSTGCRSSAASSSSSSHRRRRARLDRTHSGGRTTAHASSSSSPRLLLPPPPQASSIIRCACSRTTSLGTRARDEEEDERRG